MIKPLMQIPPTIKIVGYNDKLVIRLNEAFDFEYIFKTSQLTVHIPAPKGNPVPKMIYDFELNHKEIVREMINGKSEIPIRPTI